MAEHYPVQLTESEDVIARARIHVQDLTDSLAADPINRDTYSKLAAYLEGPGWRACDALDEVRAQSAESVRSRVVEVFASTAYVLPPAASHRRSGL